MSQSEIETVFVATDVDGDRLSVKFLPDTGKYFITVSGEDGHRAVLFGAADVENLISTLRHHREQNPQRKRKPAAQRAAAAPARRRPVGDGLDSLRSLLP